RDIWRFRARPLPSPAQVLTGRCDQRTMRAFSVRTFSYVARLARRGSYLVTSQSSGVLPIAADYQATLRLALSQRPQIEAVAGEIVTAGLQNVFLVGVGASLVA